MESFDIFRDISERTNGSIYVGVVGPVRTGKSTFIKRFMDLMVLPNIQDAHVRKRAQDELPQSGAGRTVMTSQPLFVPDEPVQITFRENVGFKIRLVDCVGYAVPGALGFEEDGGPRMVRTPWSSEEIPFSEAAEIGTRKVIEEHSTIGLVVLTDGTITDIPREDYVEAEERVISELRALGKPYLVLLNSTRPDSASTRQLAMELEEKYGVTVLPVNCLELTQSDITALLHEVLFEFPVREIGIKLPDWVEELGNDHWLTQRYLEAIDECIGAIERIRDVDRALERFAEYDFIDRVTLANMSLGKGSATIQLGVREKLFYQILQELTGFEITGDHHLVRLMRELAYAKTEYDKFAQALADVEETGYGIVTPRLEDITFDEPEIVRRGGQFGIKLQASAPSIHLVRANIVTEVTPFVGTEKQGEELARYLSEEFEKDPGRVWNSDFLGKSLQDLVREGIQSKLTRMPSNAQKKLQETLTKILNEGSGGLICIIL